MTISIIVNAHAGQLHTASPADTVAQAAAMLAEKRIGALPVIEGGQVVGIFSERDVIYGLAKHGAAMLDKFVGDVMTAPAITVTPDTAILMTKRRIRHLPVSENGKLTGFVSIGDLVKHRIEKIEAEAEAMRDYIQMA
jgi:CBS domain-containing protein